MPEYNSVSQTTPLLLHYYSISVVLANICRESELEISPYCNLILAQGGGHSLLKLKSTLYRDACIAKYAPKWWFVVNDDYEPDLKQ